MRHKMGVTRRCEPVASLSWKPVKQLQQQGLLLSMGVVRPRGAGVTSFLYYRPPSTCVIKSRDVADGPQAVVTFAVAAVFHSGGAFHPTPRDTRMP